MNFLYLFLGIAIGQIPFVMLVRSLEGRGIRGALISIIMMGWVAFCVWYIHYLTSKPAVTWDWLYWIVGFLGCSNLPKAIMGSSLRAAKTEEDREYAILSARENSTQVMGLFIVAGVIYFLLA